MRITTILAQASLLLAAASVARPVHAQTCTTDTDCAQGMVCHSQTVTTCSGGGTTLPCPANTICEKPPTTDPTCVDSVVSQCTYQWQLPCNADADCGAGFVCQPRTVGMCSGSTGVAGVGSGSATSSGTGSASTGTGGGAGSTGAPVAQPPVMVVDAGAPAPVCTTTTSFPGDCRPKVSTCSSDADCPAPWTCVGVATGGTIGVGTVGVGSPISLDAPVAPITPVGADAPVAAGSPAPVSTSTATATGTTTVSKTCQAPSTGPIRGGTEGGQTIGLAGSPDAGAGKGGVPTIPPQVHADTDAGAPVDGGASTGTTPSPGSSAPQPTTNGGPSPTTGTQTTGAATSGGGCSVGSSGTPGSLVLVGLGIAIALLRRRRQNT